MARIPFALILVCTLAAADAPKFELDGNRLKVPYPVTFETGKANQGLLALGAAVLVAVSVLKVGGIFGRRLGAGYMQFRLQATYRHRVNRKLGSPTRSTRDESRN